jgi:hypothetical protein
MVIMPETSISGPAKQAIPLERQKLIILAIIGSLIMVGFTFFLNKSVEFDRLYSDLFLRWYATTKLLDEGRNLYDPQNATEMWEIAFGHNPWGYETNFFYPAHLLIFVAPLALLPYQAAHFIWTIMIQFFYMAGLLLAMRVYNWPSRSNTIAAFIGLAFLSLPYIFHTIWGQFNTIAMLGLVLTYLALRKERYALAGVLAVSLTFKPQNDLFVLVFLLFWSLWRRERWWFMAGFISTIALCWVFAEVLQPGWVFAFLDSLGNYTTILSAVDMIWNPGQIMSILLVLIGLGIFFWKRDAAPKSTTFMGCLILSMAVWALIVPIYGWIHSVLLMIAVVWIIPLWQKHLPSYGNYPILTFIFLYVLGWAGFFLGTLTGGDQIDWVETAYKVLFPLSIFIFSVPLYLQKDSS